MAVSLVIDDATLALLVALIGALALNIYSARSSTPLLHPLLLARQAEVATVRQPNESAVYRNSNSPTGFDLAARPRREIGDVRSLIELGATGAELDHERRLLGHRFTVSNRQILADVQALAALITDQQQESSSPVTLFIAGAAEQPSYAVLIASLAATARGFGTSIQVVVLPPSSGSSTSLLAAIETLPAVITSKAKDGSFALIASPQELEQLQSSGDDRTALQALLALTSSSPSASPLILIDDTALSFSASQSTISNLPSARTIPFTQVASSDLAAHEALATADPDAPLIRAAKLVAWYPALSPAQGIEWVPASNAVLIAGVTAQLSLFPADKIPRRPDEMLLVQPESSSTKHAGAHLTLAHPAGLTLALTALYTGAAFRAQSLSSLRTEANEANVSSRVSLLYLPSASAPALARDLAKAPQSNASAWAASPLLGSYLRTAAVRTLRCGSLPAPRKPVPNEGPNDAAGGEGSRIGGGLSEQVPLPPSYSAPASLGLAHIRSIILNASEPSDAVDQSTLDTLRLEASCAVWQSYLPLHALAVRRSAEDQQNHQAGTEPEREVGDWALVTAPVTAAHSLDLQAFAPFETATASGGSVLVKGTHAGAPSVSLEMKLVDVVDAAGEGRSGDFEGEIEFRGKTVALYVPQPSPPPLTPAAPIGAAAAAATAARAGPPRPPAAPASGHWVSSAQRGSWRSNGTLVLLP
ncbi:hypothetical protein V8E36_001952 [Tilletia maclaganii]